MSDYVVVLVTISSEAEARQLAKYLLQQKLIACANLMPVNSLYMWEDEMQDDAEVLMILKTTSAVFSERLQAAIQAEHPYDVPEIITMPIVLGSADYLKWISGEVQASLT